MSKELTLTDLTETIQGNLDAFRIVREQTHEAIRECRARLPSLTLTTHALYNVLSAMQLGQTAPSDVQQWASFVRRGYIAGTKTSAIEPINIDYEVSHEEQIAEIVSRLDEIGDIVDGNISDDELAAMIHTVQT